MTNRVLIEQGWGPAFLPWSHPGPGNLSPLQFCHGLPHSSRLRSLPSSPQERAWPLASRHRLRMWWQPWGQQGPRSRTGVDSLEPLGPSTCSGDTVEVWALGGGKDFIPQHPLETVGTKTLFPDVSLNYLVAEAPISSMPSSLEQLRHPYTGTSHEEALFPRIAPGLIDAPFSQPQCPFSSILLGQLETKFAFSKITVEIRGSTSFFFFF